MKNLRLSFGVLLVLFIAASLALSACGKPASEITVSEAWARAVAMPEMDMAEGSEEDAAHNSAVSAAYMQIQNSGNADDRLVAVATDAAAVAEIHISEVDSEGVARMRPLTDGLAIPQGQTVTLEPGGLHIMLMNLQQSVVAGATIDLTLTFESGAEITVTAEIRAP